MNKKGHVINGLLLGVGLGLLLAPTDNVGTLRSVAAVTVPVLLGSLFPDVDTDFGSHRKTLHNVWVLGLFVAFPQYFDNLRFVWIGVLSHVVLDFLGSRRGVALFYPFAGELDLPFGVRANGPYADLVTLVVTAVELAIAAALVAGLWQFPGSLPLAPFGQ